MQASGCGVDAMQSIMDCGHASSSQAFATVFSFDGPASLSSLWISPRKITPTSVQLATAGGGGGGMTGGGAAGGAGLLPQAATNTSARRARTT